MEDSLLDNLLEKWEREIGDLKRNIDSHTSAFDKSKSLDLKPTIISSLGLGSLLEPSSGQDNKKNLAHEDLLYKNEIKNLKLSLSESYSLIQEHKQKIHYHRIKLSHFISGLKNKVKSSEQEKQEIVHKNDLLLVKSLSQEKEFGVLKDQLKKTNEELEKNIKWKETFTEVVQAKEEEIEKIYSKLLETEEKYLELMQKLNIIAK